jgi:hypothetical protein
MGKLVLHFEIIGVKLKIKKCEIKIGVRAQDKKSI